MGSLKDHYFGDRPYPASPGFKAEGPAVAAAEKISSRAATLRDKALAVISQRPSTADEVADALGETVLAVRPRISELRVMGKVMKTMERRANRSGIKATVWRIAP